MTREDVKAVFAEAVKIETALGGLVHREAEAALRALQEIRDIVGEEVPGGYAGLCPMCDEPVGEDETVDYGDERICKKCADRYEDPRKT